MTQKFDLHAGRFDGSGRLETPEGNFVLYQSAQDDEHKILLHDAKEREGQYGIIKALRHGKNMWSCAVIETVSPISSGLLGRILEGSPQLKKDLVSMVRELRDQFLGEPDVVVKSEQASLKMSSSGSLPICGLVVGHRKSAKGAQGDLNGETINEFDYHSELAEMIKNECKHATVIIIYRDNNRAGYSTLPGKINQLKPNFVVSLHANAHNGQVSGTETLYYKGSKKGVQLARAIQEELLSACKLSDRKVKSKVKADRGGALLSGTYAPAVIGEPFFIDNPSDLKVAVSKKKQIAKAYARGIDNYAQSIATTKPSVTSTKSVKSHILNIAPEFKYENITKSKFLSSNKMLLLQLIDGVNQVLEKKYKSGFMKLTQNDFWVLFNSEAGLISGKIDVNHRHSEGERGVLPLPSNIHYWNGKSAPQWDRPMPIGKNIEHFMLYLGHLKNKKVAELEGIWMYQELFRNKHVKNHEVRQARVLSGVVHGYFYYGNFKDKKVPVSEILRGFIRDQSLPQIMNSTTYVHAKTNIIVNREVNINEALAMV